MKKLSDKIMDSYTKIKGVECQMIINEISSLANFLEAIHTAISGEQTVNWFRGHGDCTWSLVPTALRFPEESKRKKSLSLLAEFQRSAELRIQRPPPFSDISKWTQLAQHYHLPTRLLDWTTDAAIALFFCCQKRGSDGMVLMMNPTDLNVNNPLIGERRLVDSDQDGDLVDKYLRLGARISAQGKMTTLAIQPFQNSERIHLQRGRFTLHGTKKDDIDNKLAPSLIGIPILDKHKELIIRQLRAVGTDEMSIYPEIEHISNHLKFVSGLSDA